MDITTKDVLTALGMVFMGTGVYVALVQRITKMEALTYRVERLEALTGELQENSTTLAVLVSQVEEYGKRITALDGTVTNGIAAVLAELRAKDRRQGPERTA